MAENLLDGPPTAKRAKLSSPGFSAADPTGELGRRLALRGPWAASCACWARALRPGRRRRLERGRRRAGGAVQRRGSSLLCFLPRVASGRACAAATEAPGVPRWGDGPARCRGRLS